MEFRKNNAGELFKELPFLKEIVSEDDTGYIPVSIKILDSVLTELSLEYGRYNNSVDSSYTVGYTHMWTISDGKISRKRLREGATIVPRHDLDCDFIVLRWRFRSELVRNNPGIIRYELARGSVVEHARNEKMNQERAIADTALKILEG